MPVKIAYIMSRFPHLPETFILREMTELAKNREVALYPLIFQKDPVIHPEAKPWISKALVLPYLSFNILFDNLKVFLNKPGEYLAIIWQIISENIKNPNFLLRGLLLFPKIVAFSRQMQGEGIGHIHAHYASHPALAAWVIHRLTGIPYSVTVHAHDIYARTSMLATKLHGAAFIAAISEFNREYIGVLVGKDILPKTHVIHCGIVPENYSICKHPLEQGKPLNMISVGSFKPIKGQKYLVEACHILKERNVPFHCILVGDGPEMPDILDRVQRFGLQEEVTLAGSKHEDEVSRMLPMSNCYVQPSLAEGLPVAVMEAMATGLPVVATAYSGINHAEDLPHANPSYILPDEVTELTAGLSKIYRDTPDAAETALYLSRTLFSRAGIFELIQPGVTGMLTSPADATMLADALEKLFHEPQQSLRMAIIGRGVVIKEFGLRENVARLADLLDTSG